MSQFKICDLCAHHNSSVLPFFFVYLVLFVSRLSTLKFTGLASKLLLRFFSVKTSIRFLA